MALKILSGMVFVRRGGSARGNAVISFDPFDLADASDNEVELRKRRQIGPDGRYRGRPAAIVAARQFALTFPLPHASSYRVSINNAVRRDFMTIRWTHSSDEGRVDEQEIPFMAIGEVPDAEPGPRRGVARKVARRRTRRRKP